MSKLRRPFRAGLVGLTATALVAAGLVTLVGPASAAPTSRLIITPSEQAYSAGTCGLFTVTPLDADSEQATDTATVTIRISENPNSATQDVDFCAVTGQTAAPSEAPYYFNGVPDPENDSPFDPGAARFKRTYQAGPSVTPPDASQTGSGGNPDVPSDVDQQNPITGNQNTNPSGQDYAVFTYRSGQPFRFGVAGLVSPGAANIVAWLDSTAPDPGFPPTPDAAEPKATATATFTPGGKPGSTQAADAASQLDAEPEDGAAPPGTVQFFTATVRNANGHTVFGVTPLVRVTSGPNLAATKQLRADCGATNNEGVATCAWQGTDAGVDTLVVYVNKSNGTAGPDTNEAQDQITRTTTGPTNTNPAQARFVDLVPDQATTTAGQSRDFTAIVTDKDGSPVSGVSVTFTESGPGALGNGTSTQTVTTNSSGRAVVTALTTAGQTGTQTITATISAASTDCDQPAGAPFGAVAGRCTDTATNTIVVAASPSPSPTASASASPTATASPTGTASPTASATTGPCSVTPTVNLQPTTINATGSGGVTVSGPAGRQIELFAYSQPSTTYRVVRTGTLDSNGTISFTVRPPTNTRLYAQIVSCDTDDVRFSRVLNVRTTLSLFVVRNGKQDYTFSGDSLPARPGGLIVSLYRFTSTGGNVLTAQARASASSGDWSLRRVFTGTGRFDFQVRTGQDLQNAPGASNIRSLLIF